MYIKMILCKMQDDTLILATGTAFDADLIKDREILITDFTGNIKKNATIVRAIDIDTDNRLFRFILESHTMTWEDLFEVTHVVDYKKVPSSLDK